MSIKPYISYTDRVTENSVSRIKVESKNKAILKKNIPLPTVVSLGTHIKKFGNANFFSPYLKNDTNSENKNIYLNQADVSLIIVNYNISFIEETNIINNQERFYNKALRDQIKTYIYGLDNKIGKFTDNYEDFENQILNLIKNNLEFILPDEHTTAYKVFAKNCDINEIISDKNKTIYKTLKKDKQIKCERMFLKLANLYLKISSKQKNLDTLFNDIQNLFKQHTVEIRTI